MMDDGRETRQLNENIESIIKSIEEISDDQRELVKKFKLNMELFASERSLESCVQTLNQSMQLAEYQGAISRNLQTILLTIRTGVKKGFVQKTLI